MQSLVVVRCIPLYTESPFEKATDCIQQKNLNSKIIYFCLNLTSPQSDSHQNNLQLRNLKLETITQANAYMIIAFISKLQSERTRVVKLCHFRPCGIFISIDFHGKLVGLLASLLSFQITILCFVLWWERIQNLYSIR